MPKRSFRPLDSEKPPSYPTLKAIARGVRSTILGVAIAAGAAGCDGSIEDDVWTMGGVTDAPPAPLDIGADAGPDHSGGLPDMMPAPLDLSGVADAMTLEAGADSTDDIYTRPDLAE